MNSFFTRKYVILAIFIAVAITLLARLFYIQIIDKSYFLSANNNVLRKYIIYPARGVIVDRKDHIMVLNEPVYDLMVIPREVPEFDTLALAKLINVDKEYFLKRFNKARNFSPFRASLLEKQLSAVTYASLQERLFEFPGFYIQKRTVRSYPDSTAAQFVGYINEVNEKDIENSGGFYRSGDYIGRTGVEKSYEVDLRGQRGVQNLMVDAFNRPKGHFAEGRYDTLASAGAKLTSSMDVVLQKYGEALMKNKIGSIVAIEPSSGEVLAMVSSPTYDPNLMVGRYKGNNYMKLLNSPNHPLFIRPTMAEYPPGSIFKVINALVGQQMGSINAGTQFLCTGGYHYGRRGLMRCTHVHGTLDLAQSIQFSCNTYYGYVYNRMVDKRGMRPVKAYTQWREAVEKFGIGTKLQIDLPHERRGNLPSPEFYTRHFRSDKWTSGYNISLSIGQGELGITPLQMANVVAAVANRGFFYRPHLVKNIVGRSSIGEEYTTRNSVGVDARYFDPVIEGMSRVVNSPGGTAANSRIPDIEICGKTGTVQNPHGDNHSVFFAFAPRNNPKIAIAVVVENAGYGATWSAPIASLMIEKYLRGTVTRSKSYVEHIMQASLLPGMKRVYKNSSTRRDSTRVTGEIKPVESVGPKPIVNVE